MISRKELGQQVGCAGIVANVKREVPAAEQIVSGERTRYRWPQQK